MRVSFVDALYLYSTLGGIVEIRNDLIAVGLGGFVGFGSRLSAGNINDNRESRGII